jgi:hypothetical protein
MGRARAGMTVVELMISTAVLFLLCGAAFTLGTRSTGAFSAAAGEAQVDERLNHAVSLSADLLRCARADTLVLATAPGACALDFDVALAYDDAGGGVAWRIDRFVFEDEPGEPVDGLDNDGDGLIDEGRVTYVRDRGGAGEIRTVLAYGVARAGAGEVAGNGVDDDGDGLLDEPGLQLTLAGGALRLELTLQGRPGGSTVVSRTLARTMGLNN